MGSDADNAFEAICAAYGRKYAAEQLIIRKLLLDKGIVGELLRGVSFNDAKVLVLADSEMIQSHFQRVCGEVEDELEEIERGRKQDSPDG